MTAVDTDAFASFATLVGVISGLVGILTCLYGLFFCIWHLPDAQYRQLEEVLRETDDYYRWAIDDGAPDKDLAAVREELGAILHEARELRIRAHRAVGHWQQWAECVKGLSLKIYRLRYRTRVLRARIMDLEEDDDAPVTDIWSRAAGPGLPLSVYRYNERTPGHVAPADSSETLVSSREMDDKMDDKGCWTDGEDDVGLEGDDA